MTLLEMIVKYEGIKSDLERGYLKHPPSLPCICSTDDGVEIVGHILRDLRRVLKDTSEITIHDTLLEKIGSALEKNHLDDALKLSQMLPML